MTLTTTGSYHYVIASRKYHTRKRISARALSSRHAADIVVLLPVDTVTSIQQTKERQNKLISWLNWAKISCPFTSACRRTCFFLYHLNRAAQPSYSEYKRRIQSQILLMPLVHDIYTTQRTMHSASIASLYIIYCLWNRCGFNLLLKTFFASAYTYSWGYVTSAVHIVFVQNTEM